MKEAMYTNYEELPLFLNSETLAKLLGISVSSSYELARKGLSCNPNWLKVGCSKGKITTLDRRKNEKVRCK